MVCNFMKSLNYALSHGKCAYYYTVFHSVLVYMIKRYNFINELLNNLNSIFIIKYQKMLCIEY